MVKVVVLLELNTALFDPFTIRFKSAAALGRIVRFSLVPLDIASMVTPPATAADVILMPVTLVAALASTCNAGVVAPSRPTVSALAEDEVIVPVPELSVPNVPMVEPRVAVVASKVSPALVFSG